MILQEGRPHLVFGFGDGSLIGMAGKPHPEPPNPMIDMPNAAAANPDTLGLPRLPTTRFFMRASYHKVLGMSTEKWRFFFFFFQFHSFCHGRNTPLIGLRPRRATEQRGVPSFVILCHSSAIGTPYVIPAAHAVMGSRHIIGHSIVFKNASPAIYANMFFSIHECTLSHTVDGVKIYFAYLQQTLYQRSVC